MRKSDEILTDLVDASHNATVRQIIDEVVEQIGGPSAFARIIATDLREAVPGSANRIRLTTALLRLMEQTQPTDADDEDLDDLEEEARGLLAGQADDN